MLHFIQGVLACILHHLSQRKLHSLNKETQADNLWGKQLRAHSPESQEYFVSAQGEKQDGWWITGTYFSVHLEPWGWSSVNFKSWLRSLISGRVKHQGSSQGGREEPCLEMASMCLFRLRVKGPAAWPDQVEGWNKTPKSLAMFSRHCKHSFTVLDSQCYTHWAASTPDYDSFSLARQKG